jgi:hypothetical protein
MRALAKRGIEFSVGAKQSATVRAVIDQIDEDAWTTVADYPTRW